MKGPLCEPYSRVKVVEFVGVGFVMISEERAGGGAEGDLLVMGACAYGSLCSKEQPIRNTGITHE